MRAAIYIRVSTDEQAAEGFSIDAQKRRLLSYADSQDWTVADIFIDDGFSAKDLKRPAMQRMIKSVENKLLDVVLVYKLDRLTRATNDCDWLLKHFEKNDVKFQSATESFETRTATGRLFIRLVADIAQWERENTAERVRMGIEQMVIEGKKPGGVRPYGYTTDEQIIEEEAAVIRKIKDYYLSGFGTKSIAEKLNSAGLLRRGSEWRQSTVMYTLENPYYAGIIRLGEKTKDGKYVNIHKDTKVNCIYSDGSHTPIYTKEEYEEIKNMMARKSNGGYSRKLDYWFSGALRCGKCGSAMFGRLTTKRKHTNGEIVRTPYYICSKKHDGRDCSMPTFRQVHVEHLLLQYLNNLLLEKNMVKDNLESSVKEKASEEILVEELNLALNKIKERRKKWQYMFVNELITSEELHQRIHEEISEEKEINKQLKSLERFTSKAVPNEVEILSFIDYWHVADDLERKELIFTTFSNITINTDEIKPKGVKNKFFDATISTVEYM